MCPENARVFHIEDKVDYTTTVVQVLERYGHRSVGTATSYEDALKEIEAGLRAADVVVLDGSLTLGGDVDDGKRLAKLIRQYCPNVKIIGNAMNKDIPGVDKNCTKNQGASSLAEAITNA